MQKMTWTWKNNKSLCFQTNRIFLSSTTFIRCCKYISIYSWRNERALYIITSNLSLIFFNCSSWLYLHYTKKASKSEHIDNDHMVPTFSQTPWNFFFPRGINSLYLREHLSILGSPTPTLWGHSVRRLFPLKKPCKKGEGTVFA
jgi:hypothetical protein